MTTGARQSGSSSVARLVVFTGIGAVLFWLVVRGQHVADIREKLSHARWQWAAVSLGFAVVSNLIRAARWRLLIHPLGERPRFATTFGAVLVGYMANLALPRLGEITRCAVVNRYEGTPISMLFGTVVVERLVDVLTILLCLALVVALAFDRLGTMATNYVLEPITGALRRVTPPSGIVYVAAGVLVVGLILAARILWSRAAASEERRRLRQVVQGFVDGLRTIGRLEQRGGFVFYSAMIWVMYGLMGWVCFRCFDATAGLGPTAALAVVVFGGIGFAAPVQGGLGTFELVVTPTLVAFGVPSGDALSYAILYHATQVGGMLAFGLIALVALPFVDRRSGAGPAVIDR